MGTAILTKAVPKAIAGDRDNCRWLIELQTWLSGDDAKNTIATIFPGAGAILERVTSGTDTDMTVKLAHNRVHLDLTLSANHERADDETVSDKGVEIKSCKLKAKEGHCYQVTSLLLRTVPHCEAETISKMLGKEIEVYTQPDQTEMFDKPAEIGTLVSGQNLDGGVTVGVVVRSMGGRTEVDVFGHAVQLTQVASTITLEAHGDTGVPFLVERYQAACKKLGVTPMWGDLLAASMLAAEAKEVPMPAGGVWWISGTVVEFALRPHVDSLPDAGEA